jgi:RNA polymerase sigma factor (sigma-70 family)
MKKISKNIEEDILLVQQLKKGSTREKQAAAELLYNKYKDPLTYKFGFTRAECEKEDFVLEVFQKIFENIHKFNVDRGAFSTWLFNIAKNMNIDKYRQEQTKIQTVQIENDNDTEMQIKNNLKNPEERLMESENAKIKGLKTKIKIILANYNDNHRIIFELRYFHELTYDQIAEYMCLPIGTVKGTLFRTKDILKNELSSF